MLSRTNAILAGFVFAVVAGALVWQRFGFFWHEGPRWAPPEYATVVAADGTSQANAAGTIRTLVVGDHVRRGEKLQTEDGAYLEISLYDGTRIALDEQTDAVIESLSKDEAAVRMTHGRIAAEHGYRPGNLVIRTNETESAMLAGSFTVIDERERAVAHVIPFGGRPVGVIVHKENGFVASTPQEVHEIAPYEVKDGSFRLVDAAKGFYARFGLESLR